MSRLWYILAGWCVLLAIVAAGEKAGPPGADMALRVVRENLKLVSDELRKFEAENGRFPTNDEGLSVFVREPPEGAAGEWLFCEFTSEALDDRVWMHPMPGGIIGWAGVPLVYENRRGVPADAFESSPANEGEGEAWRAEVADGVFVYSLPGRDLAARVRSARHALLATVLPLLTGAALLVFLGVRAARRSAAKDTPRPPSRVRVVNWVLGVALVLVGAALGLEPCMVIACYPGTVLAMRRDEKAAAQYAGLLEDFHRRGVIRDDTYRKLVEASNDPDRDPMRWR